MGQVTNNMSDHDLEAVVGHLKNIQKAIASLDSKSAESSCIERVSHAGALAIARMEPSS